MILVDTSAWLEFFRGRDPLAAVVDGAIEADQIAICGPVVTELRRGLRSGVERRRVLPLLAACHALADPARLWEQAGDLGLFLARRGVTSKSFDLLIATFALSYGLSILAGDHDFADMRAAGVRLAIA